MATMATQYTDYPIVPARRVYSWPGIFAGTFVFLAIESTFGVLGAAIFGAGGIGLQIWMVILSIIALYFAGRTSSKLLARDGNLGMYHGLITFGMSVFSTILVIAISLIGSTGIAFARTGTLAGYVGGGGEYWLFVALVLSMIAAAVGGMHGVGKAAIAAGSAQERTTSTRNVA